MNESQDTTQWGRVDETNTVFVRDGDVERKIGQYPDGTPEEAVAYFERKYLDLAGQVTLLEQRILRGTAGVEAVKTAKHLQEILVEPAILGDIESLRARVSTLLEKTSALAELHREERAEAREASLAARESIVAQAEAIAESDLSAVQWKQIGAKFDDLFSQWQVAQKQGPHIPKTQADELWKRFRKARLTVDAARRAYFSQLDSSNKGVKAAKQDLIRQAEALADKGAQGVPAYRELLEKWKRAGRASKKIDDQLWAQFKAAGDVLYAAKSAEDAVNDEEYAANLASKVALLEEARPLLNETDHLKARETLAQLQKRWDAIGKVPKASVRDVEFRLRKLESHVKQLQDEHWQKTNPETTARAEGLRGQLENSISELETRLSAAKQSNDVPAIAEAEKALETQRSWLAAIDG